MHHYHEIEFKVEFIFKTLHADPNYGMRVQFIDFIYSAVKKYLPLTSFPLFLLIFHTIWFQCLRQNVNFEYKLHL